MKVNLKYSTRKNSCNYLKRSLALLFLAVFIVGCSFSGTDELEFNVVTTWDQKIFTDQGTRFISKKIVAGEYVVDVRIVNDPKFSELDEVTRFEVKYKGRVFSFFFTKWRDGVSVTYFDSDRGEDVTNNILFPGVDVRAFIHHDANNIVDTSKMLSPYHYFIKVSGDGLIYQVAINDVMVSDNTSPTSSFYANIPLNTVLKPGDNIVKVRSRYYQGENPMEISIYDYNTGDVVFEHLVEGDNNYAQYNFKLDVERGRDFIYQFNVFKFSPWSESIE